MLPLEAAIRLGEVERLTGEMLAAATAQDWHRLAELEERRRGALAGLFADSAATAARTEMAEGLRRVLAADREVIARGEAGLREAASALADLERGRRGIAAYRSAESG